MAQKEFIHVLDKCSDFDDHRKDIREHEKNIPNVFSVPKCATKYSDLYLSLENVNDKLSTSNNNRKDVREFEKSIPNVFTIPKSKSFGIYPLSVVERDNKIPNVFQVQNTPSCATTPNPKYAAFVEYMNVHCRVSDPDNDRIDIRQHEKYIPNVFSLSKSNSFGIYPSSAMERDKNIHNLFKMQKTISYESLLTNEKTTKRFYEDLFALHKSKSESWNSSDYFNRPSNVNSSQNDSTQDKSLSKKNVIENDMSTIKAMWCVMTAKTIRGNPNKPFPVTEINTSVMLNDIRRMLTNRGTEYYFEDPVTKKFKFNGKYSIFGLSPDMLENVSPIILECANLFKILSAFKEEWEEDTDDSLLKAFMFALSRVLADYERTVFAVKDESLLALLGRLSRIVIGLRTLAEICDLNIKDRITISPQKPSAVKLINKVYNYLSNCQLSHSVFVRMLIYILDYCCMIYFRMLSDWTLRGVISDQHCMFIKLYSDDNTAHQSQLDSDNVFIDENIEVPDFMKIFKEYILTSGRSAYVLSKLNDIEIFSTPTLTCCFDYEDAKRSYMSSLELFKCSSVPRRKKSIRRAPNLFRVPDWKNVERNEYDLHNPYGFFMESDKVLTYHGKPIDIPSLLKNLPYTILIPSRMCKINCNRQILDRLFKQETLLDELQYLSQCFFLVNSRFTSKLCETLYESMAINRQNPRRLFNQNRLRTIVDDAIQCSFPLKAEHGFSLKMPDDAVLDDPTNIKDVECIELEYEPKWPKSIILTEKMIVKYKMLFLFLNKLEYVTWCLSKVREILSVHKNDVGLQFRQINLFKHSMVQFTTSMHQYFKQVVISECWTKFDKRVEQVEDVFDLYSAYKEYMHELLRRCFMVVGLKDKLTHLNKIYTEILNFYELLHAGYFHCSDFQWVHTDYDEIEETYFRFSKLRRNFYEGLKKTAVSATSKHSTDSNLHSLIIILGP
ncbi:uncharacterized protein LOC126839533 isoform X2 [Adelges cooleyi]|uniref:uncharacterized protein LOC126839533 isoform X2 n=1 Tax=Adelges cooleyi TaxID=133065 RepID=UPI00217F7BC9|nr:uncharacterized protein LOC126839533 isoform X2 [Adelges cooleyi]